MPSLATLTTVDFVFSSVLLRYLTWLTNWVNSNKLLKTFGYFGDWSELKGVFFAYFAWKEDWNYLHTHKFTCSNMFLMCDSHVVACSLPMSTMWLTYIRVT